MHKLIERLISKTPVITDGAWGTQMQARGLEIGRCPDSWNLEHPERVEEVARAYVEAGSQIILTNTFGANRLTLAGHGLADKVAEVNRAGVQISKRAAGNRAFVFASVGQTGKMIMTGEVTEDELTAAFEEQTKAITEGGADGIVVETMADLEEAKLAVAAAKRTGLAVVASMVFDSGADHDRTMMGIGPEQVAQELTAAGADVVGANCGNGIEGYVPICKRLHAATPLPIWVKANAGMPELVGGRTVFKTKPQEFARHAPALVEAGASFIGGCCGTTPDFIKAVCEKLKSR
jgi:methionine synthase I (cobalamin-dependent)